MKTIYRSPLLRSPRAAGMLRKALAASVLAALGSAALAQVSQPPAGGPYVLSRQVIAAGAERSVGGPYALTATVAQTAVDPQPASGATYRLSGGFHIAAEPLADEIFANGFED